MSRFPDVRSCLVGSERTKPQPDLRQMDWAAVNSFSDLDVCVFRIAKSIQDIDTIKVWLRHNEFSVGRNVKQRSDNFVPQSGTEPVLSIDSVLSVENFRKIFPRHWLWEILGIERVYIFSLGILLSRSGQVVGVSSMAIIE